MSGEENEWFRTWFDSRYYHKLYKHRDATEAHKFLDLLTQSLNMQEGSSILDVGCGRGRHTTYLGELGFNVLGIDLSPNSIAFARQFENDHVRFAVHDMREELAGGKHDYIFNLFTSFGYFQSAKEDEVVLSAMKQELAVDGTLVIDYMNSETAIESLQPHENITVDNIDFDIHKHVGNGKIFKDIAVEGQQFREEVRLLSLDMFQDYAVHAGFDVDTVYGNYQLEPYNPATSDRMILILKPNK